MDKKQKLEYIVRHYIRLMQSTANGILKDHHEAEDACQETLMKLCRVIDRIDDVTTVSARAYVVTAVRNTAFDMVRKNNHLVPVEEVFDNVPSVAVFDDYPSDTQAMVEDIEKLPDIYRDIIRMRCFERKSASQIAKELNTKVSTVNSRLCRARDLLKAKWFEAEMAVCGT